MKYRVESIRYPSLSSSLYGISADVYFNGCAHECPGCHNVDLWEFVRPTVNLEDVVKSLKKATKAKVISVMGGEPLQQRNIVEFLDGLAVLNKPIALFTGYDFEEVPEEVKQRIDFLKAGRFMIDQRTPSGSFLASINQKMFKKYNNLWLVDWQFTGEIKEARTYMIK